MTAKQRRLLDFIEEFIRKSRYSPSIKEMKDYMGVKAYSTIHQHLQGLIKGGYLTKDGKVRGYILKGGELWKQKEL